MKKYFVMVLSVVMLASCKKDIFDKSDLTGVESTNVWNNESTANLYTNKTYDLVIPVWPTGAHNTSDESNNVGSTGILYGQLTSSDIADIYSAPGTGIYSYIRRTAIALEGLDGGSIPYDAKAKIKAQNYFLRAYMYFNLVKLYGGVPLVLHVQDVVKEDLNTPRSKTSECIDSIVRDLDSCTSLPATWTGADKGRITRGAALALKGKVLMFWASAQFNPNNDVARWQRAYTANKEAYDMLVKDGYGLNPNFSSIFLDETSVNKEPIIIRIYDQTNKTTTIENGTRPVSESAGGGGSNQPTWNLVKAFPMKNGLLPYNADGSVNVASGYDPTYYWKNRDPRFDATVAYNGVVWPLSGKAGRIEWTYTGVPEDAAKPSATGFYNRKITNPAVLAQNALIGSGTDWIEMRFAEVLLNLAECANATGNITEAMNLVIALRKRAGIDAGANSLYGLKTGMTQAEMFSTIINERRVEFAFEGKRYDDLRRTRLFSTLNGTTRLGLKIALNAPYTTSLDTSTAAKKLNNLEYYFKPGVRMRDTINVNTADYTKYFKVTEFSLDTQFPINFPNSYYFYPMPLSALQSNTGLKQTLGWVGGSFDPLQ